MKRIFDLTAGLAGMIILSPLFIIIIILIKVNDKGPVLFKQKRVGKNGKLFTIYKFRSMRDSESLVDETFRPGDLSRITKIGSFLRQTKLDEIPQLINVVKGEMSLVGPRPEVEKWVAVYPERWKKILQVKPGITDNSSVVFINEEYLLSESSDPEKTYRNIILPKKLDLYEEYVNKNSFAGDLLILFKTISSLILK